MMFTTRMPVNSVPIVVNTEIETEELLRLCRMGYLSHGVNPGFSYEIRMELQVKGIARSLPWMFLDSQTIHRMRGSTRADG